ncbi:creatininase family protein [Acetobacter sp. AN02]|uniref:creatininase family protein n=1 Tax=Acetobacter sp. AN02 TaxID=2894186 RepID=UPI00243460B3|nr:creatininase family protein [Acetobacter sp. AN02]MDG6094501.1 creatininase family protein [Acetobacter sp. AN02]
MRFHRLLACFFITAVHLTSVNTGAAQTRAGEVEFGRLTWTEIRTAIGNGQTTIIIPIGGTEQSGPYIAVGKHNIRAAFLADQIARQLGNALVAPVIAYVPEGGTSPRTSHMRFPGTITIPPDVFVDMLRSAAESFRVQGFRIVIFLGDHGGYQKYLIKVSADLNASWKGTGARTGVAHNYYTVVAGAYADALREKGFGKDVGLHAELSDTSLMLATDPSMVRSEALHGAPRPGPADGVYGGDPRRATAALGETGIRMQISVALQEIRKIQEER